MRCYACRAAASSKSASRLFGFSCRRQFAGNETRADDVPSNGNVVSRDATQKSYFRFFQNRFTAEEGIWEGNEDGGGNSWDRPEIGLRLADGISQQIHVYEWRVMIEVIESNIEAN